jgi:hypothetical protein
MSENMISTKALKADVEAFVPEWLTIAATLVATDEHAALDNREARKSLRAAARAAVVDIIGGRQISCGTGSTMTATEISDFIVPDYADRLVSAIAQR